MIPDGGPAGGIRDGVNNAIDEEEDTNRGGDFGEGELFR